MPKSRSFVLPALLAVLLAACVVLLWLDGNGRMSAVEPPELRAAPGLYSIYTAPVPRTSG